MTSEIPEHAERVAARLGSTGVYSTPADLVAWQRTRTERALRTLLTFAGVCTATPLAFLIPPVVEEALRREAIARAAFRPSVDGELGGRPPQTWSPAASDWRDRKRS
jgi:hypothetical protein